MSVRIAYDTGSDVACLYCSTTGWAFGPVFSCRDDAEDFLAWLEAGELAGALVSRDPRRYRDQELARLHVEWEADVEFGDVTSSERSAAPAGSARPSPLPAARSHP